MAKKQTAGQRIIGSARHALAFAEGKQAQGCEVHIPEEIDVRRIRAKAHLSQGEFATYFGVSVRTVQQWEQGRAAPSGAARAFLTVIDREPEAVRRALVSTISETRGGLHR